VQTAAMGQIPRSAERILVINNKSKGRIALNDTASQSYGTSLAMWDHTVLPAIRHKWMRRV